MVALIVDDDAFFRESMQLQLAALGIHNILLAEDGEAALDILRLRCGDVDLVVCDVSMPEADGFHVLSDIAHTGFDGKLLFVSGMDPAALQLLKLFARSNAVDMLDPLEKPISLRRLDRAISSLSANRVRASLVRQRAFVSP
jgi:CheY-like chemotaxis protein